MSGRGIKKTESAPKTKSLKRKLYTYSEESLKEALKLVRSDQMSIRSASRQFRVPRATIQDRIHGRRGDVLKKTGPQPIMGVEGEKRIADWAIQIAKCGFPIKKQDLLDTVTKISKDKDILDRFGDKGPGIRWYKSFLKRHPEISVREAEGINKARSIVTEEFIRSWFRNLDEFLEKRNFRGVMLDSRRIFNGDESGFAMCPKTGKVLAPRGWKNLYQIKSSNEKENLTVLIVFNANGDICPPLVIFPYVRPPKALVDNMPPKWVLAKSETGWMRGDVFYEYICNDFNEWLNENKIERPIILFIDGHKSHMTLPLSQFCEDNGIILYALPPNTTHMLQPADVSVFKPLKQQWKNTVRRWQSKAETANAVVNKMNFCSVFQETLENINMVPSIRNGFRRCGLFPLDPNEVDYTKCVKNTLERERNNNQKVHPNDSEQLTSDDIKSAIKVIKAIENRLYEYGINVQVINNEIDFLVAENLENYENFNQPTGLTPLIDVSIGDVDVNLLDVVFVNQIEENTNSNGIPNDLPDASIIDKSNDEIPNSMPLAEDSVTDKTHESDDEIPISIPLEDFVIDNNESNSAISNDPSLEATVLDKSDEEIHPGSSEETENEITDLTDGVGHRTPETNVVPEPEHGTPINEMTENESSLTPFSKHLSFPDLSNSRAVSLKKKEKLPSAISCKEWRRYYETKDEERRKKTEAIQKRKELRELNRQQKSTKKRKRQVKKTTKKNEGKKKNTEPEIEKEREICFFCEDQLYSETEDDAEKNLGCDVCERWYHLRCTELAEYTYEEASTKEYICDICK